MAAGVDFSFTHNAPFTANLVIQDENGGAIDYTGSTFKLQVKAVDSSGNPTGSALLTLTTGSGIAGAVASGEIQPTFPAQSGGGLAPGPYAYDCVRLVSASIVEMMFAGSITVMPGVSS